MTPREKAEAALKKEFYELYDRPLTGIEAGMQEQHFNAAVFLWERGYRQAIEDAAKHFENMAEQTKLLNAIGWTETGEATVSKAAADIIITLFSTSREILKLAEEKK